MIKAIHKFLRGIGRFFSDHLEFLIIALIVAGVAALIWGLIALCNNQTAQDTARCNREEDTLNLVAKNDPQDFPRVLEMFRRDCGAS